jgi:hypothetical protein
MGRVGRASGNRTEALEPRRLLAGQISGTVFNDLDADGQQDISEPGLPGWTVYLDDNLNDRLDAGETSTLTSLDGSYTIPGAGDGVRRVAMVRPSGWQQTTQSSGRLFMLRSSSGVAILHELDPLTGASLIPTPLGIGGILSQIGGAALGPRGLFAVVSLQGGGGFTIYELDGSSIPTGPSTFITSTAVPSGAAYLNGLLYLAVPGSQSIMVFDPATRSMVNTLSVTAPIGSGLCAAAELGVLLATDSASPFNKIHVLDPATGGELRTLTLPITGVAGGMAFVNGQVIVPVAGLSAYRIDPDTGSVLGRFPISTVPASIVGLAGDGSSQLMADLSGGQDATGRDFGAIAVTAPPAALDLLASSDTGTRDFDNVTTLADGSTVFRVHGTVPGATVILYNAIATVNSNPWGSAVATGTTTDITLSVPAGFPIGSFNNYPFTALQQEPGKLRSWMSPGLWAGSTGNSTAPEAFLAEESDTGFSNKDRLTNDVTPTFFGNANDGEIVSLYAGGVNVGSSVAVNGSFAVTPSSPLAPGSHTITFRAVNGTFQHPLSSPISVTIRTAAPTVTTGSFAHASAKPTLNVGFSASVWGSLLAEDFVVTNLDDSTTIPASVQSLVYTPSTMAAAVTFPGLPDGVLPDGDYRLTLPASLVSDDAGNALAADYTLDFFVLAGDADHDRDVDVNDLGVLASNWQGTGKTFAQGDFNYDGTVNVADLGILATNWQKTLAANPARPASSLARGPSIPAVTRRSALATRTTDSIAALVLLE